MRFSEPQTKNIESDSHSFRILYKAPFPVISPQRSFETLLAVILDVNFQRLLQKAKRKVVFLDAVQDEADVALRRKEGVEAKFASDPGP